MKIDCTSSLPFRVGYLNWLRKFQKELSTPYPVATEWSSFLQSPAYFPQILPSNTEILHLEKAAFASGKVLSSLMILSMSTCGQNATICDERTNKTLSDFITCSLFSSYCVHDLPYLPQESSLMNTGPFFSSLGSYDACRAIPGFQYCGLTFFHQSFWRNGVCVPATIHANALQQGVLHYMDYFRLSRIDADSVTVTCGDTFIPWSTGTYIILILSIGLISLSLLATWLEKTTTWNGLEAFSLFSNGAKLLAPPRGSPFDCLDGIRTLSIFWVIYGHTFAFETQDLGFSNLLQDVVGKDEWITSIPAQILTGAYFAVDTFFFLSGFLATFLLVQKITSTWNDTKGFRWVVIYLGIILDRYIRLTPVYVYLLLVYLYILPILSSGPFWWMLGPQQENCFHDWWANLLYINNFIPDDDTGGCYPVTWYLANDFQLFLIVPLLALLATRDQSWKRGVVFFFLGGGILSSILWALFSSMHNHWSINLLGGQGFLKYFHEYYIKPWGRCPPYLMGILSGLFWYKWGNFWEENGVRHPWKLTLVSFSLMGLVLFGERQAYASNPIVWSNTTMSLYIAFSKPAWTLGLALLCILLFSGRLPWISFLLKNRLMSILARLSYCAYLVHPIVIAYFNLSVYTDPPRFSGPWYALVFAGNVFSTFLVSCIVYLMIELPLGSFVRNLQKPRISDSYQYISFHQVLLSEGSSPPSSLHDG